MKTFTKIMMVVGIISGVGLIVYAVRRYKSDKRHAKVAEEGYETAYDILFPQKEEKRRKVQYGPVIPGKLAV